MKYAFKKLAPGAVIGGLGFLGKKVGYSRADGYINELRGSSDYLKIPSAFKDFKAPSTMNLRERLSFLGATQRELRELGTNASPLLHKPTGWRDKLLDTQLAMTAGSTAAVVGGIGAGIGLTAAGISISSFYKKKKKMEAAMGRSLTDKETVRLLNERKLTRKVLKRSKSKNIKIELESKYGFAEDDCLATDIFTEIAEFGEGVSGGRYQERIARKDLYKNRGTIAGAGIGTVIGTVGGGIAGGPLGAIAGGTLGFIGGKAIGKIAGDQYGLWTPTMDETNWKNPKRLPPGRKVIRNPKKKIKR